MIRRRHLTGIALSMVLLVCAPQVPVNAEDLQAVPLTEEMDAGQDQTPGKEKNEQSTQPQEDQNAGEGKTDHAGKDENEIPKIRISIGDGQSTPQYQAGDKVEKFSIKVTNAGVTDAKDVRIVPVIDDASLWPFVIESMNYELNLGEIKAGKTAEAAWKNLTVREDVETKSYKTPFAIVYNDGTKEFQTNTYIYVRTTKKPDENTNQNPEEQPADQQNEGEQQPEAEEVDAMGGIYNSDPIVTGGDSGNKSVPRVIVTGFTTDPASVNAGINFRLIVHLKNTSTATAVSNMLFDLQAPSAGTEAAAEAPAFLPASGSSSVYLDSIPAGETRDIAIDLNARADLVQKPYSIQMTMKYEDSSAVQYEGASSLAIPVQQAARFEFSEIEISPDNIQIGEEANLTCSLYNTGRTKLYNVKVKFDGEGISGKEIFVGNVDSGATGTIDAMLTGESETKSDGKCKMIVSYEDESGKSSAVEEEFTLTVVPASEDASAMPVKAEPEKGFPVIPVVAGVAAAALIVLTVFLLRRRKKKRALLEEEDLADEVDRFTEDE